MMFAYTSVERPDLQHRDGVTGDFAEPFAICGFDREARVPAFQHALVLARDLGEIRLQRVAVGARWNHRPKAWRPILAISTNLIECDAKTLRKHYRRELDTGATEANLRVAQSLYNLATKEQNVAGCIWWTKARMGWKEATDVNVGGNGQLSVSSGPTQRQRPRRPLSTLTSRPTTAALSSSTSTLSPRLNPATS